MTDQTISRESVEERTRRWLEQGYRQGLESIAADYEPVWSADGQPTRMSRFRFEELQRKLKVFRWLDRLSFESFIDVGSGFDIFPKLVEERYGVAAYFSDFTHTLNLPFGGMASGRLDRAVTLNAARLPFDDGTFDVVLASEVLEHLVRPLETIAELVRVSRKYVIMTSLEALSTNWRERLRSHLNVDVTKEHVERNFFLLHELDAIFGPDWLHENLLFDPGSPVSAFASPRDHESVYGSLRDKASLRTALCKAIEVDDHRLGAMGVFLIKRKTQEPVRPASRERESALAAWLIDRACDFEQFVVHLAVQARGGSAELPDIARPVHASLLALLRCPDCRAGVVEEGAGVRCVSCNEVYPGEYGVPTLYPRRLPDGPEAIDACVHQLCGNDAARAKVVRRLIRRLRRNERPAGVVRRLLLRATSAGNHG